MTRKSKRELERAVEDLGGDVGTARAWVDRYLAGELADGYAVEFGPHTDDPPGEVCILEERGFGFYAPREDVPETIDIDADLPVRA